MRTQIANFLAMLIHVYSLVVFLYVISSWLEATQSSLLYKKPVQVFLRFLHDVSEPYVGLYRRVIPPLGFIDITPLVAILVLQFFGGLIVRLVAGG